MLIMTDTFIPYDFNCKEKCLQYVVERCHNIRHSLRLVDMDDEHIRVRCPIVGDYLNIIGSEEDLKWLHNMLIEQSWYRTD